MNWTVIALLIQIVFATIIGVYFWTLLKTQRNQKVSVNKEAKKELEKLRKLRAISLSEPLAEKVRPTNICDIVGQEDGIRALKAALSGPNPQHVIIYGPPGVGKTAAARLILEEAKKSRLSPFREDAVFIEIDGTTARFDERGIADPLIGSVHDPIYQGAGAMGQAGIPQPKQGAVTKAHGGVLFIDEIGELHSIQLNKLLKVLEDRKVYFESAYYSRDNANIPQHIHDIFQNGLPADFRLIGATTRPPDEIPPALRSRCLEVYFRSLTEEEIVQIAKKAAQKIDMPTEDGVFECIAKYATNGRQAVNLLQIAAGIVISENRKEITLADIEWVIQASQLPPRIERKISSEPKVGVVNGLAVYGPNQGYLLEIEVKAIKRLKSGQGKVTITGIVEEESTNHHVRSLRKKSMAKSSVENVLTVLRSMGLTVDDYDIHINFPGGLPVDGPSAGIAIAVGVYSAIKNIKVANTVAMTGEIGVHGTIKRVGGIKAKVEAAKNAGATTVLIPKENEQSLFTEQKGIHIIGVETIEEVLKIALINEDEAVIPASVELHRAQSV